MDILWLEQNATDVPAENQWLSTKEKICLSGMRFAKRRTDWRLGRWTAKHAVAASLNLSTDIRALADIEIPSAPSGAPEVFLQGRSADIAISLSHRDGTALCSVAPAGTNFGCDLETIEPRSDGFVADYFTASEKALISRTPVEHQPLIVALVWSAKESALKALHLGLRLDTRCVCVRLVDALPRPAGKEWQDLCPDPVASNPDGWRPLSVHCSSGPIYGGCWRSQDHLVRTIVSNLPLRIPARVRQESGLAEASWFP
ncbi:MAG: 4'-phosphopantetheinyl transferase superfamily protein [Candidatus Sulfotelmatobacter sp.]